MAFFVYHIVSENKVYIYKSSLLFQRFRNTPPALQTKEAGKFPGRAVNLVASHALNKCFGNAAYFFLPAMFKAAVTKCRKHLIKSRKGLLAYFPEDWIIFRNL